MKMGTIFEKEFLKSNPNHYLGIKVEPEYDCGIAFEFLTRNWFTTLELQLGHLRFGIAHCFKKA